MALFNFSLSGLASKFRLGKNGNRIESSNGAVSILSSDETSLAKIKIADPTDLDDAVTLRWIRENQLSSWSTPVQSLDELASIPLADLRDKQIRLVEDERAYYQYDAQSTASVPDPVDVKRSLLPNGRLSSDPGRWILSKGRIQQHSELLNSNLGDDHPQYQLRGEKNLPDGYAGLDENKSVRVYPSSGSGMTRLSTEAEADQTLSLPNRSGRLATDDVFTGRTDTLDGSSGLVPLPSASTENRFLRDTGVWATVTGTLDAIANTIFEKFGDVGQFVRNKIILKEGSGIGITVTEDSLDNSVTLEFTNTLDTTDQIPETVSNRYFTESRVLETEITGVNTSAGNTSIGVTDTILLAFGKLQNQISSLLSSLSSYVTNSSLATTLSSYVTNSALGTSLSAKQDTLQSGTNIKTINSQSIVGSGNIVISAGGGGSFSLPTESTEIAFDIDPTFNVNVGSNFRDILTTFSFNRIENSVIYGNFLLVVGNFSTFMGQPRKNVACIDLTTWQLTPFDPIFGTAQRVIMAVRGNRLYLAFAQATLGQTSFRTLPTKAQIAEFDLTEPNGNFTYLRSLDSFMRDPVNDARVIQMVIVDKFLLFVPDRAPGATGFIRAIDLDTDSLHNITYMSFDFDVPGGGDTFPQSIRKIDAIVSGGDITTVMFLYTMETVGSLTRLGRFVVPEFCMLDVNAGTIINMGALPPIVSSSTYNVSNRSRVKNFFKSSDTIFILGHGLMQYNGVAVTNFVALNYSGVVIPESTNIQIQSGYMRHSEDDSLFNINPNSFMIESGFLFIALSTSLPVYANGIGIHSGFLAINLTTWKIASETYKGHRLSAGRILGMLKVPSVNQLICFGSAYLQDRTTSTSGDVCALFRLNFRTIVRTSKEFNEPSFPLHGNGFNIQNAGGTSNRHITTFRDTRIARKNRTFYSDGNGSVVATNYAGGDVHARDLVSSGLYVGVLQDYGISYTGTLHTYAVDFSGTTPAMLIAGDFTIINGFAVTSGTRIHRILLGNLNYGAIDSSFLSANTAYNNQVTDIIVLGGTNPIIAVGTFTTMNALARQGVAWINSSTGALQGTTIPAISSGGASPKAILWTGATVTNLVIAFSTTAVFSDRSTRIGIFRVDNGAFMTPASLVFPDYGMNTSATVNNFGTIVPVGNSLYIFGSLTQVVNESGMTLSRQGACALVRIGTDIRVSPWNPRISTGSTIESVVAFPYLHGPDRIFVTFTSMVEGSILIGGKKPNNQSYISTGILALYGHPYQLELLLQYPSASSSNVFGNDYSNSAIYGGENLEFQASLNIRTQQSPVLLQTPGRNSSFLVVQKAPASIETHHPSGQSASFSEGLFNNIGQNLNDLPTLNGLWNTQSFEMTLEGNITNTMPILSMDDSAGNSNTQVQIRNYSSGNMGTHLGTTPIAFISCANQNNATYAISLINKRHSGQIHAVALRQGMIPAIHHYRNRNLGTSRISSQALEFEGILRPAKRVFPSRDNGYIDITNTTGSINRDIDGALDDIYKFRFPSSLGTNVVPSANNLYRFMNINEKQIIYLYFLNESSANQTMFTWDGTCNLRFMDDSGQITGTRYRVVSTEGTPSTIANTAGRAFFRCMMIGNNMLIERLNFANSGGGFLI
jgi:hypothetical protein